MSVKPRLKDCPPTKTEFYDLLGNMSNFIHRYIMKRPLLFRPYIFEGLKDEDPFASKSDDQKREYYLQDVWLPDMEVTKPSQFGVQTHALAINFGSTSENAGPFERAFTVLIPAMNLGEAYIREYCVVYSEENPIERIGYTDFEDEMHFEQFVRIYETMLNQQGNEINLLQCEQYNTPIEIRSYFEGLFAAVDEVFGINFLNLEEAIWFHRYYLDNIGGKMQLWRSFQQVWSNNQGMCAQVCKTKITAIAKQKEAEAAINSNPYAGLL